MCLSTEHYFDAQNQQEDLIIVAQNFHSVNNMKNLRAITLSKFSGG